MRTLRTLVIAFMVTASTLALSQTAPPATVVEKSLNTYMVTYNIYELENGKRVNTRTHKVVLADNNTTATSRSEQRIPLATNSSDYVSTGVQITTRLQTVDGKLLLNSSIDMEYLAEEVPANARAVLHKASASASGNVKLDKPTLLAAVEDQQSKRSFQIEVLITKQ
ncbi:MAG: hypothetical protein P4M01_11150 [Acidobacteriota bacterium]|nr:hypothetical protein [Acidobacteriota bacterium]